MTYKFGFEIEGFYFPEGGITLPPKGYPTDDFPGLVEARTIGGGDLREQIYLLHSVKDFLKDVSWTTYEHKFSPLEKAKIRARHYEKGGVVINNIYGKSPKDLGSRTLASFQINISLKTGKDKNDRDVYGVFDFPDMIRAFDEEFKDEIKASGRQEGFYSIKENCRFEYRSLPNFVGVIDPVALVTRIKKCL